MADGVDRWKEFLARQEQEAVERDWEVAPVREALTAVGAPKGQGALEATVPYRPEKTYEEGMTITTPVKTTELGKEYPSWLDWSIEKDKGGRYRLQVGGQERYLSAKDAAVVRSNPELARKQGILTDDEATKIASAAATEEYEKSAKKNIEGEVAKSDFAKEGQVTAAGFTSDVDRVIRKVRALEAEIASASGDRKKALEGQAEVLKTQAQEMAAKEQEMADRADRRVRGMELMKQRHDEATARAEAEIRNAERMVTSHEIDPNRAFKTTGARVGSAIAIAMSALGQGMSGRAGPNTAYKIINDAINRDIDLQKEELRTRKDVLRNKNNLYANMMAKFGNERSAELATAKAGMTAAVQSLQALKATHKSQNAHLVIDEQIGKIEAEGQKKLAELYKLEGNLAISKMNIQGRAAARGSAGKAQTGSVQSALAKMDMLKERFKKVGKIEGAIASVFSGLNLGGMLAAIPFIRDAEFYEDARNLVAKEITRAFDGGRPTDKDFAILLARLPPSISEKDRGVEKIEAVRNLLMAEAGPNGRIEPGAIARKYASEYDALGSSARNAGTRMKMLADKEDWEFFKEGQ
tara:strand:+ start:11533 stop:13275 length:1743 start_codon:yes stop_codon:yes gene_type:complete